jgi:hypothetical protein
MIVNYRENEAIYIRASGDRVTVIFKTMFSEETDRVFGKVFLQVNHLSLCLFIWLFFLPRRVSPTTRADRPPRPAFPIDLGVCRRTTPAVHPERASGPLCQS